MGENVILYNHQRALTNFSKREGNPNRLSLCLCSLSKVDTPNIIQAGSIERDLISAALEM